MDPVVRTFLLGRATAVLGMQCMSLAVAWHLYERTGSAWVLGLVGLFQLAPILVSFAWVGHVVDRYPRRGVAMAAHGLLALGALGLAAVVHADGPSEAIYALLVAVGLGRAFAAPAGRAILPQLVPADRLASVNAWLSATFELATIAGPAVGGLLIAATGGAAVPIAAAAGGILVFVACLARLPALPAPARGQDPRTHGFLAGLSFVRRQPVLLAAITLDLFGVLLGGAVALLPVYAKDILHVRPTALGWLRAAPAVGAATMALVTTRLRPWRNPGRVLLVAVAGFGVATVGFGLSRDLVLSLACLALVGVFDSISVVIRMTLEQVVTPDALRGRVAAVNFVFIGLSNELGAFESGAVAALVGPVLSVVGGGLGTLAVVAVVLRAWPALARIGPLHTLRPLEAQDAAVAQASGTSPPG